MSGVRFTDGDFRASVRIAMNDLLGRVDRMRSVGATGITSVGVPGGAGGYKSIALAVNVANCRVRWFVNGRCFRRAVVIDEALRASRS